MSVKSKPETEASPSALREAAIRLVRRLQDDGFIAYFAGGCVRDRLLNQEPKDYDIATNAVPEQVTERFRRTSLVGAHFGVVLVKEPEASFEIATFRADGEYRDGRHPESVTFSSPEEDAKRRDFTINGLFEDPIEDRIIDFVGGQEDLQNQVLRAIGVPRERFHEDFLRMLRAIRFAARLGFAMDESTMRAIREERRGIHQISAERIREELVRILIHPSRLQGFDLLHESGLLEEILPEMMALQGCEQPPQFHPEGDVFVHTRLMLSLLPEEASLPLVLSVLLHDIAKPATYTYDEEAERIRFNGHDRIGAGMTEDILRRLKFSNDVINATVEAVANHMNFKDVQKMRTAKLKRFMARPHFDDELELHRVDCMGSSGKLDNYEFLKEKKEEFESEPLIPEPLIRGDELIRMGWKPGPIIGEILEAVQTLQLEGELKTHDEAIEWVRTNYAQP